MASMAGKRPVPPGGDDSDAKRVRSNGSPAEAPAAANGMSEMERKKQEAAARMAAVKAKLAATRKPSQATAASAPVAAAAAPPPPPPPAAAAPASDVEAKKLEAQRKIAEMKAKMAAKRAPAPGSLNQASPATPQPPSDREQRIAEARARAQQIAARATAPVAAPSPPPPPPRPEAGKSARGGLGIGLHPSLMGDMGAASAGKSKGARGNQQREVAPRVNPYLAVGEEDIKNDLGDVAFDPTIGSRRGGGRKSKQLEFNQKGKFMAQANALRNQAKLEQMKKEIAAEARKVEIEEASDKAFLVPMPPDVEWWDEGLVDKIDTEDTIITALIQHPVILQAPQDKFLPAPKPLMLTPVEQKKLRRQRRMADMKEEQAKIRLGLLEPPPPKVKKSNMMQVLGEQAVKDPTAVEARVNKEIAQRANDHAKANADRALTKEQRLEKLKAQQAGDEAKGIRIAVFKVDNLSSGKHRYKVDQNAKDQALTGIVVLHPQMNLIIVEGGTHSIEKYKKLMLNRIQWSENTMPLAKESGRPSTFLGNNDGTSKGESGEANRAAQWIDPLDENGQLKDLSENKCQLVFEGQSAQRVFRKWMNRACETDGEARDILGRSKMEHMWTLARSMRSDLLHSTQQGCISYRHRENCGLQMFAFVVVHQVNENR
ncbi:U4/U5/U6 small nuclear ribonucleoprotein prp3 [Elasticomyces elasticus]|uniref:U4/U5/U6 small nuclear ribonucleoprotein prp3 n=1 Tax=Elasticomyces elasticus TaxID=574655 RepID=A0AAN7W9H4_9PEZI|nr:U4/U5/U6 small nuclear ribonucleoprotein prp3 [Elasticomyces elasticus]